MYWLRNPSQPEIPFFVLFYGICSIGLTSSAVAGCGMPKTVLTLIRYLLPVSFGICGLDLKLSLFPQDIHGSSLDASGEETYECTF